MSLPRPRALEPRAFLKDTSFPNEPDHSVIMLGIAKLRAAREDVEAVMGAIEAIPAHLLPSVAVFAGERHKILPSSTMQSLLDIIGLDNFARFVGEARALTVWRRYRRAQD